MLRLLASLLCTFFLIEAPPVQMLLALISLTPLLFIRLRALSPPLNGRYCKVKDILQKRE